MREIIAGNHQETIMKAKGHSLWLMPKGVVYDRLSGIIKRLAIEYNAPVFSPHVTLLGEAMQSEVDIIERIQELVSGQKPFPITLSTVGYGDAYFKALFVEVGETEPLLALHERAKGIFDMKDTPPYKPHISLFYGNSSSAIKKKMIDMIGGGDQAAEFMVGSIHLFKTDGEANVWYKVKEFPLS